MVSYFISKSSRLNEIQNADCISQRNPTGTLKGTIANINIKSSLYSKYNTPITFHLLLFSRNTGKRLHRENNVRQELIANYLVLVPTKNAFIHNSLGHSTLSTFVVQKKKKELVKKGVVYCKFIISFNVWEVLAQTQHYFEGKKMNRETKPSNFHTTNIQFCDTQCNRMCLF